MGGKDLFGLVRQTAYGWAQGNTFQLGAALAFCGVFTLAPTLVIAIALAGIFFGEEAAKGRVDATLEDAMGPTVARAVAESLTYVHVTRSGWTATCVGFGLVLFAATGLFIQLQMALNAIWRVRPRPGRGIWNMVRSRFFALVLVLGVRALLLLALVAHTPL